MGAPQRALAWATLLAQGVGGSPAACRRSRAACCHSRRRSNPAPLLPASPRRLAALLALVARLAHSLRTLLPRWASPALAAPPPLLPPPAPPLPAPPGYRPAAEALRRAEFARLGGRVYADYAGAPPYSEALLAEVFAELR